MIYIALLRGINVGGKNKIDMKTLKRIFEQAGMDSVKTYINSGNIIFSNKAYSKEEATAILEEAIYIGFELRIKVLLYNIDEFKRIAQSIPAGWTNDQQMKSDVLFLWEEINEESILDQLTIKPEIDVVKYVPGAILWSVDRDKVTKSGMSKIIGSVVYRQVTVRNVNTVRKIMGLMEAIEETEEK